MTQKLLWKQHNCHPRSCPHIMMRKTNVTVLAAQCRTKQPCISQCIYALAANCPCGLLWYIPAIARACPEVPGLVNNAWGSRWHPCHWRLTGNASWPGCLHQLSVLYLGKAAWHPQQLAQHALWHALRPWLQTCLADQPCDQQERHERKHNCHMFWHTPKHRNAFMPGLRHCLHYLAQYCSTSIHLCLWNMDAMG